MDRYVAGYMEPAFREAGIPPENLLFAVASDMDRDGAFRDVYLALDAENLYILTGTEKIVKARGAKRIRRDFMRDSLEIFPLSGLEKPEIVRRLSVSRLIFQRNGAPETFAGFTAGMCGRFESLIKAFNNIKEGKPACEGVKNREDELFCPKCGSRYRDTNRKICAKCLDKISIGRRLLAFFGDYRKKVLLIMLTMLSGSAFGVISPYIGQKMMLDDVLAAGGKYYGQILWVVLLLLGINAVSVLLGIVYSTVLSSIVPWIVYDLKLKIFTAMQRLSVGFYTSKQTGSLMNRVNNDASNVYWFFVDGLPYLFVNVLTFIGVLVTMLVINWRLSLVAVVVVPTIFVIYRLLWRLFGRLHHRRWVFDSRLSSMVSDALNGQRVIKAFAKEEEETGRFRGSSAALTGAEVKLANTDFTAFPLISLLMFSAQVVITGMGSMMVINGTLEFGTLMLFISYLGMLFGPLDFLSWVSNWWSRCVDSAQRMFEIIDAIPDVAESENPADISEIRGDIEIDNVCFEYEPGSPIIKEMSLDIKSGHMLGIVGKTGAGKSTLANLIARLYDVGSGEIRIDGINVKDIPSKLLRRSIGIVSQEIFLFMGTIADNIRYAKPDADIKEVISAAKAASAHDFIMKLPDGYETRIGAGGQDLSGGEKQRLSIARAIIQNPRILILDEATASMDTETELRIQNALSSLKEGRTTIAIAHRLSTLRDAELLAVIEGGKVVETGTHDELMRRKGEYHKLYMIQMEALKVINMDAKAV